MVLDVQPPELLHELLPQEDAGLIPVAKLRGSVALLAACKLLHCFIRDNFPLHNPLLDPLTSRVVLDLRAPEMLHELLQGMLT